MAEGIGFEPITRINGSRLANGSDLPMSKPSKLVVVPELELVQDLLPASHVG
jgi:hypothetical protein